MDGGVQLIKVKLSRDLSFKGFLFILYFSLKVSVFFKTSHIQKLQVLRHSLLVLKKILHIQSNILAYILTHSHLFYCPTNDTQNFH